MPLFPTPFTPSLSPLPTPGERPADRGALRLGAVVAILTIAGSLVAGQLALSRVLFVAPGLQARAATSQGASAGGAAFQGFTYLWTKRSQGQGGFNSPASLINMQSEGHDFHMNVVVIPVIADMPRRSGSDLYWRATDHYDALDTLPDLDYMKAIDDARKAGLEPIMELEVRQQDIEDKPDESSRYVGENWYYVRADQSIVIGGVSNTAGAIETTWFDNYTAFAVHFAQLAQSKHLKYFIVGDGLANLTGDGPKTTAQADPHGIPHAAGDTFDASKCSGRHECEWRHVLHAVRAPSYSTYNGAHPQTGGRYTGKIIYAASWAPGDAVGGTQGEFETIQWWDGVDAIGVDAFFVLTQTANLQPSILVDAWHGRGTSLAGQGDIYSRLQKISDRYNKLVVFTAAGYESTPGSNASPGQTSPTAYDPDEQLTDMQALLQTFSGTPWWAGAIWYYDQPLAPRSAQFNWLKGTQWAGDNLNGNKDTDSKPAGVWLSGFYNSSPVPCLC